MAELSVDDEGNMKLTGAATVHEVEELRESLMGAVSTPQEGRMLDLCGVTALDSAGIQLLLSLKLSCPDIKVHSCPNPLRELLDRLGLATHLL